MTTASTMGKPVSEHSDELMEFMEDEGGITVADAAEKLILMDIHMEHIYKMRCEELTEANSLKEEWEALYRDSQGMVRKWEAMYNRVKGKA